MKGEHADVMVPEALIEAIRSARSVVVVTGAGASAESGIATFRDALAGLWAEYDPMVLATPEGFREDPALVTRWYDERRVQCFGCEPNAGHFALAAIEEDVTGRGAGFLLLTQNVDRLHQRAGSRRVEELHGSLFTWRCVSCGESRVEEGGAFGAYPPRCEGCGGMRRPGVVWFGELLPERALSAVHEALPGCDLFMSIGTSGTVEPVASFVYEAKRHGAATCEINRDATMASGAVDWSIRGRSGEVLPVLAKALRG